MTLLVSIPVGQEGRFDIHKACLAQKIIPNLRVMLITAVKVASYEDRVFFERENGLKNFADKSLLAVGRQIDRDKPYLAGLEGDAGRNGIVVNKDPLVTDVPTRRQKDSHACLWIWVLFR